MDGVTGWNQFRNYEMSVWTLQDSYIATLKTGDPLITKQKERDDDPEPTAMAWPQARAQGQIQNGQMEIDIDGTQKLSFDIPMYIYINGKRIENPNWYNNVTKNVLVSMRKIKVIFNKWQLTTQEERSASTFEFIILKVQEQHEQDNLVCHVECEGLAFHELGKIGYKCSLSADEFNNQYYNWSIKTVEPENPPQGMTYDYPNETEKNAAEPIANISYWMENRKNGLNIQPVPKSGSTIDYDKMDPNTWYYDVRMSHSSMWHENNVVSNKIYEEGFPTDWDENGDAPTNYMELREMARLVELKESNIYNITQDLAEKFQVFCRYEYVYNNNYNIIGRIIIFYNNFLQEGKDVQTLLYPNSATKIMREMDSTDISTKMFVRSVDAEDLYLGEINMMDCSANRSKEDYLLNFDYLHEIGTISNEQYDAVTDFEKAMRKKNNQIIPLQSVWSTLSDLKIEADKKVSLLQSAVELDQERITENENYINALDAADGDEDGYITRDYRNPLTLALMKDTTSAKYDTYYVQLNQNDESRGIKPDTLELYKDYHTTTTKKYEYGLAFEGWKKKPANFTMTGTTNTINAYSTFAWGSNNSNVIVDYELKYKGTYGKPNSGADVIGTNENPKAGLPSASNNKGWFYRNIENGDLSISNGSAWKTISSPSGYKYATGYYKFKKTIYEQANGLVSEECSCTREGATDTSTDYITHIQHVYYTVKGNSSPSKPTAETATTDSTKIVDETSAVGKWSYKIGTPDEAVKSGNNNIYYLFGSWELTYAKNKKSKTYTNVASVSKDASDKDWREQAKQAGASALREEDRLKGKYVYKDHNLDQVTGLFIRDKVGSYAAYGAECITNNTTNRGYFTLGSTVTYSTIQDIITNHLNVSYITTMPGTSARANKFVIIQDTTYHNNGNKTYAYSIKYYGSDDVPATPPEVKGTDNAGKLIQTLTPIFYLDTKNNKQNIPTPDNNTKNLTVSDDDAKDKWTYKLPNRKYEADDANHPQAYYTGWEVKFYDGTSKFYVDTSSHKNNDLHKAKTNIQDSSSVPKYVYATFKYKPSWYYENIKNAWVKQQKNDNANLTKWESKQSLLKTLNETIKDMIEDKLNKKNDEIAKFEHMMGAALRESYWQPEDEYQDYGTKYKENLSFFPYGLYDTASTFVKNTKAGNFALSGWDAEKFDEENEIYYEVGTNRDKVYYPCIDLSTLTKTLNNSSNSFLQLYRMWATSDTKDHPFAFFFNPTNLTIPVDESTQDIRYCDYYTIGSRAHFAMVRVYDENNNDYIIKPVLILTDAALLFDDELQHMYSSGHIGRLYTEDSGNNVILKLKKSETFAIPESAWLNVTKEGDKWVEKSKKDMKKYQNMYPRILIPSLKLKTNTKDLALSLGDEKLEKFEDYYLLINTYYKSSKDAPFNNNNVKRQFYDIEEIKNNQLDNYGQFGTYYTITIKPEYMFAHYKFDGTAFKIKAYYAISNADMDIYLDAKKILKENAYPKVSYEIEVSKWSPTLLQNIYNKLAQIVMINDTDLKLQDTFGYISNIKLDLDHEEKDSVEVKNYKTKFEDLFSKIVAETEEMHKNSRNIGLAGTLAEGSAVDAPLSKKAMEATLQDSSIQDMLQDFIGKYFDGADVVQKKLQDLWNDTGAILGSAAQSLNSVISLTSENAAILNTFRENVTASLTPKIFTGSTPPEVFKPGDIWIDETNGYQAVATGYNGRGGFTRTHDGQLAAITGASLDIDAEAGSINILAETEINLMSGQNIYIAAGDTVDIVGNKAVNIGGTTINMASCSIEGNGYEGEVGEGGIHLVATTYTYNSDTDTLIEKQNDDLGSATSRVDIHGNGIELASANGIIIKSGAGIVLKSSDDNAVTAISIDKKEGIFMGAGATEQYYSQHQGLDKTYPKIRFYSGTIDQGDKIDATTNRPIGASVELSKDHLLMGMANVGSQSGTVAEMTVDQIIIAAGKNLDKIPKNDDGSVNINKITEPQSASNSQTTYELTGVQIKSNYIGMATGADKTRSIFSMTPELIQLGQMTLLPSTQNETHDGSKPEDFSGSYLWLAKDEIYIGTLGNFTVNTNNIKIQSKVLASGSDGNITTGKPVGMGFALGKYLQGKVGQQSETPQVGLGFWMEPNDGPTHLMVDGDITAQTFVAKRGTSQVFMAASDVLGFYSVSGSGANVVYSPLLTIESNGNIKADKNLTIETGSHFSVNANSNRFIINSSTPELYIANNSTWSSATKGIKYDSDGLSIKGEITATSGTIGGWTIGQSSLYSRTYDPTNQTDYYKNGVGMSTGSIAFYAGRIKKLETNGDVSDTYEFKVTNAGAVTANTITVGNTSGNAYMKYSNGVLTVKGTINATGGSIGGWTISNSTLNNNKTGNKYIELCVNRSDEYLIYAGATEPEGSNNNAYTESNGYKSWGGTRSGNWAPFRLNTYGELYTETLCLGNGPSNATRNDKLAGDWSAYVGKLWLLVKENGYYQWHVIDSTQLWNMLQDINTLWGKVNGSVETIAAQPQSVVPAGQQQGTSGGCFIAGTLIELADGTTIAIEKLQLGTLVKAYDEETRCFKSAKITALQLLEHKAHIYDIYLSSGQIITMTASHPLLTIDGWKSLDQEASKFEHQIDVEILKEGDKLITEEEELYITKIKLRTDLIDETVYHCRVEPYHTFVVSNVVAHNAIRKRE